MLIFGVYGLFMSANPATSRYILSFLKYVYMSLKYVYISFCCTASQNSTLLCHMMVRIYRHTPILTWLLPPLSVLQG